ncbi:large ribosomal subunit protein mL42-like [Lineus longissimus]|uniref:large ribosomal subunit protein mL42-like n=1 Tax=Lineus longissimus TaxID=88925 RepID=UPI002B4E9C02
MSASMAGRALLKRSRLLQNSLQNCQTCHFSSTVRVLRAASNESNRRGLPNLSITVSDDGATIMCWHPEQPTPYEHTKPIIRKESDITEGDSVLKVQLLHQDEHRYEPDGPRKFELMNMFFTTKHRWFPPGSKAKKRKAPFPRSRESI